MMVPTRRIGTFFNVAQFIVINLVIILICLGYSPTAEARKQMPLLIDDESQHNRMNRPGKFQSNINECFVLGRSKTGGMKLYVLVGYSQGTKDRHS